MSANNSKKLGAEILSSSFFVQPPSPILVLKEIITLEELVVEEEYREILQDMTNESSKFGRVLEVRIPRPDPENKKAVQGLGNVYIHFLNVNQAKAARRSMIKRLFRKRIVEACYLDEKKFELGELELAGNFFKLKK